METIQPYEGGEAYIFVSYARKDKNRVFPFLKALQQAGYRIWYDAGVKAGELWQDVIGSHIRDCGACLAFISAHSGASRYCRREIQYADKYQKSLIPFYLEEGVSLSPGMELIISGIQSLKLSECPTPEEFIERLKRSESFRRYKGELNTGELHTRRRGAERAARRERETGAPSANAQSELSASPEFLPRLLINGNFLSPSAINEGFLSPSAINGGFLSPSAINEGFLPPSAINEGLLPPSAINEGFLSPSATAAGTGTNGTLESLPRFLIDGDFRPSSVTGAGTGAKKARRRFPKIRAIYVNGMWRFTRENETLKFLSIAEAMRLTFEAIFNNYLGAHPAPDKIRTAEAFIRANPTFLRFEAVSGGQFAAKAPLYLNGFSSPVYLATTNDTPTKRKYVTRLCRYLHKERQKSRVEWITTDGNLWLWRSDTDYEMESVSDSGS